MGARRPAAGFCVATAWRRGGGGGRLRAALCRGRGSRACSPRAALRGGDAWGLQPALPRAPGTGGGAGGPSFAASGGAVACTGGPFLYALTRTRGSIASFALATGQPPGSRRPLAAPGSAARSPGAEAAALALLLWGRPLPRGCPLLFGTWRSAAAACRRPAAVRESFGGLRLLPVRRLLRAWRDVLTGPGIAPGRGGRVGTGRP